MMLNKLEVQFIESHFQILNDTDYITLQRTFPKSIFACDTGFQIYKYNIPYMQL